VGSKQMSPLAWGVFEEKLPQDVWQVAQLL